MTSSSPRYASGREDASHLERPPVLRRNAQFCLILGLLLVTTVTWAQGPPAAPARPTATAARTETPRLVVLIVSDQFRADYFEMYGHQWTHGLRRLYDRGAV